MGTLGLRKNVGLKKLSEALVKKTRSLFVQWYVLNERVRVEQDRLVYEDLKKSADEHFRRFEEWQEVAEHASRLAGVKLDHGWHAKFVRDKQEEGRNGR